MLAIFAATAGIIIAGIWHVSTREISKTDTRATQEVFPVSRKHSCDPLVSGESNTPYAYSGHTLTVYSVPPHSCGYKESADCELRIADASTGEQISAWKVSSLGLAYSGEPTFFKWIDPSRALMSSQFGDAGYYESEYRIFNVLSATTSFVASQYAYANSEVYLCARNPEECMLATTKDTGGLVRIYSDPKNEMKREIYSIDPFPGQHNGGYEGRGMSIVARPAHDFPDRIQWILDVSASKYVGPGEGDLNGYIQKSRRYLLDGESETIYSCKNDQKN